MERRARPSAQTDGSRSDEDRKSTRLNSSHSQISYAVFCLKKKTIAGCRTLLLRQALAWSTQHSTIHVSFNSHYSLCSSVGIFSFFFNDTATSEIYTLSLHDALPIFPQCPGSRLPIELSIPDKVLSHERSEEHTSELQSQSNLVCRLLLEKKKTQ